MTTSSGSNVSLRTLAASPKFQAMGQQERADTLMKFAPYDAQFLAADPKVQAMALNHWTHQGLGEKKSTTRASTAQSLASLGDVFAGAPAFLARTGMEFGSAIVGGLASPWTHQSSAQIWHDARQSAQAAIAHASKVTGVDLSAPLEGFLQKIHPAPGQENTLPNKAFTWLGKHIDTLAEDVAKKTKGVIPADATKSYIDALMTTGGGEATRLLKRGKAAPGEVSPAEEPPTPEPSIHTQVTTGEAVKAATGATPEADLTHQAQSLMDRNASIAEVQAAIKKNKKLGPEIDRLMEERRARAQAFQDKESKIGQVQTPEEYAAEQAKQEAMQQKALPADKTSPQLPSSLGHADPKLLALMAAGGVGALIGAGLAPDDPVGGAVLGAIATLTLGRLIPKVGQAFHSIAKPYTGIRLGRVGDIHEVEVKQAAVIINNLQYKVNQAIPDPARRAAITHWLEGDTSIQLTPEEKGAAQRVKEFYAEADRAARAAGVYEEGRQNYVTHLWDWGIQRSKFVRSGLGTSTPYAKGRTIPTLKEGMSQGLTPLTQDISEIVGIYGNSMMRVIANKHLINTLKASDVPDAPGKMIMDAKKAPFSYQPVEGVPSLLGMRVHPDIAQSLQFMGESRSGSGYIRALEEANSAIKRLDVSGSLFHAKSLLDAFVATKKYSAKDLRNAAAGGLAGTAVGLALGNPAWGAVYGTALGLTASDLKGFLTGTDAILTGLREQGLTPEVNRAIKAGLLFSLEKGAPEVEDVGTTFYGAMTDLQRGLDNVPVVGKLGSRGMEHFKSLNHKVDTTTWSRLHAGMKLIIFLAKASQLRKNNPELSIEEADRQAAEFTNDIFGGLNWRRLAEETHNHVLRQIALWMNSPKGRRLNQLLIFAPDWTLSTARVAYKAVTGKGTGLRGLVSPKVATDLYRQYMLRSLIYYNIAANAINYAFTGHSVYQNKDPFRIDLGNGQTMSWSKHFTEPFEWLKNPSQQFANKLAFLPSEAIDQLAHTQYLNASDFGASPPMKEGRLTHALGRAAPINLTAGSPKQVLYSTLGTPIYGETNTQRMNKKLLKKISPMTSEELKKKIKRLEETGQ